MRTLTRGRTSRMSACWAALHVACTGADPEGEVTADYVLDIVPHTLANQDVFDDARSVKLLVRNGDEDEVVYLGEVSGQSGSQLRAQDLGPIEAERVGVVIEDAGASPTDIEPTDILAYREFGPLSLTTGEASVEVLLAARAEVGTLGTLPLRTFGSAAVMLPGGDVLLFGGLREDQTLLPNVLWMTELDGSAYEFVDTAQMPAPRMYGTATLVEEGGETLVLVAGGRTDPEDPTTGLADLFLYDPSTNAVVYRDEDGLFSARSEHRAFAMPDQKVVLVGGYVDGEIEDTASYVVYDVDTRTVVTGDPLDLPPLGFAGARIGSAGLLLCGGGTPVRDVTGEVTSLTPSSVCERIDIQGRVASLSALLPDAVHSHDMVGLGDGRALLTGGAHEEVGLGDVAQATEDAWLYDPGETTPWQKLSSAKRIRALHRSVPLPDGRILLVGGSESGGPWLPATDAPVQCPEIFDPKSTTFENTRACNDAGSGADPVVAWSDTDGAFVLAGRWPNDNGGDDFGFIGFGPTDFP